MANALSLYNPDLSVNIYDGVFQVSSRWVPEVAEGYEPVEELIPLEVAADKTSTQVAQAARDINRLLRLAREFVNTDTVRDASYLRLTTEVNVQAQSLIYDGRLMKRARLGSDTFKVSGPGSYVLRLRRHPLWEETTLVQSPWLASGGNLSPYGGKLVFSGVDGDDLARIGALRSAVDTGSTYDYTDLWVGFHPIALADEGDEARFDPHLYQGPGADTTTLLADTSQVSDTSRHGTGYIRTTFATQAGLRERTICGLKLTSSDSAIYQGRYLCLVAARVTSGTTAAMQLRVGYAGMSSYNDYVPIGEPVEVTSTTWDIISLGYLQLPPFFPVGADDDSFPSINVRFTVWAQRLSGSNNLEWDAIVLLPAEHAVYVSDADDGSPIQVITRPDDKAWQYGGTWLSPDQPASLAVKNWGIPPRNSVMVIVADEDGHNENLLNDVITVENSWHYPRWRNYAQ